MSAPDRADLSRRLGFEAPEALTRIVALAHEWSGGDPSPFRSCYRNIGPLDVAGDRARYGNTPPELFPIASTGVDGVHWGYLVRAPEIGEADHPIAEFCPMDSTGISMLGDDTRSAWASMLREDSKAPRAFAERLRQELDLPRRPPRPRRAPRPPKGWRFVPTADRVGVLAPDDAFGRPGRARPEHLDALREAATSAIERGSPATALLVLREAAWRRFGAERVMATSGDLWATAYVALGRTVLAEVIERTRAKTSDLAARQDAFLARFQTESDEKRFTLEAVAALRRAGLTARPGTTSRCWIRCADRTEAAIDLAPYRASNDLRGLVTDAREITAGRTGRGM